MIIVLIIIIIIIIVIIIVWTYCSEETLAKQVKNWRIKYSPIIVNIIIIYIIIIIIVINIINYSYHNMNDPD